MEKSTRKLTWSNFAMVLIASLFVGPALALQLNYGDALQKSFLFYEAQRSGKLPSNQRANWRGDSGLSDGSSSGVDLVGGYYDAGDNVKFGLPMAFTITMLSWSVIEYQSQLEAQGQLGYALDSIKWGTDYMIKAHPQPNLLYGEVGDGDSDHYCWQRPEDMTTSRQAYSISPSNPGSDLAGETAAAMAAASIAFKHVDAAYSNELLNHARQLFSFADMYRGKYDSSISVAKKYYQSDSGYDDELLWAAIWLHEASGEQSYLQYVADNGAQLGGTGWAMEQFGWDNKYVGVQLKATKLLLDGKGGPYTETLQLYQAKAEYFLCAALQKNNGKQMQVTPGGMYWVFYWNNMQYVSTAAFVLTVAHDYYTAAGQQLSHCSSAVDNTELLGAGKAQVDYILGNNNRGMSYLVGFGQNYPQHVHHRASSIVSIKQDSQFVSCRSGYADWYQLQSPNPNILVGALVGGPDENDDFVDRRDNFVMTEATTYNTAPLVGVLARLQGGGSTSQSSPDLRSSAVGTTGSQQRTHQSQQNYHPHPVAGHGAVMVHPPIVVVQELQDEWAYEGKTFYKYAGTVINNSKHTINNLTIVIHRLHGPIWGLTPKHVNGNYYTLPQWTRSLSPGQRFDFAYVHSTNAAQIFVGTYNLE